jgi:hypothetical protein
VADTSTMIAVKDALVDVLTAALPDVQVSWGHPGKAIQRECVVVGNVRPGRQEAVTMGSGGSREERYTVAVACNVAKRGSQREVSARAVELAAEVEEVLRADDTLGLGEAIRIEVADQGLTEAIRGDGREAEVPLGVEVRARLRR